MRPTTYLDGIVADHRRAAAADGRRLHDLLADAEGVAPTRDFAAALRGDGLVVVAEIKRRSPSKGDLVPDLVPRRFAAAYEAGGAACLSVLTDADHFGGSPADLAEARAACSVPVLRKDFTVDERDVVDARLMGADAVLLIVAALDDDELRRLAELAQELGLCALVEVHDALELDRALAAGASVVGVNSRDLRTFEVSLDVAVDLRPSIPDGVLAVAESGIRTSVDARRMADAGFDAVLVGEALVRSGDPEAAVRELAGLPCS